jgi:hypothetical protein
VEVIGTERVAHDATPAARREGGRYAGRIVIAPDFDEWPPDIRESLGIAP